jgi:hypothetical protein
VPEAASRLRQCGVPTPIPNAEGTDDLKSRLEIERFATKFDLRVTDNPELELKFIQRDDTGRGQVQKQRHQKGHQRNTHGAAPRRRSSSLAHKCEGNLPGNSHKLFRFLYEKNSFKRTKELSPFVFLT